MLASFLCGDFLLHIPYWLIFYMVSFSYTSRAGFIFMWGVSLTHPELASFSCGEFLLHIPCWLPFYLGISLTHTVLALFFCGEILLHIPCLLYFSVGSFSYTSYASFFFFFCLFFFFFLLIWGVSLTHPCLLVSFLCGEVLLHRFSYWFYFCVCVLWGREGGDFSYTFSLFFFFFFSFLLWGVSLRHPMLALFVTGVFLLLIPCWYYFLSAEFLLHILCWFHFYLGSVSYTSRAGFFFFFFFFLM